MRDSYRWILVFGLTVLSSAAPAASLHAQGASSLLHVEVHTNSVGTVTRTNVELATLPREERRAEDHGRIAMFSGVRLVDVLRSPGVPIDSVRGRRSTLYVLVTAADGYRALFSLAELAPDLADAKSSSWIAETVGRLTRPKVRFD